VTTISGIANLLRLVALRASHRRSMMVTLAWPPPSHMVTMPYQSFL
jgi:hypothetical protein